MKITSPALCALLLGAMLTSGCSKPDPSSSPEALVEAAYEAIRTNSWEDYSKLTVTTADFILKEHNAQSAFKQKQSYVGSQLKPEEQARQRQDFARAVGAGRASSISSSASSAAHSSRPKERRKRSAAATSRSPPTWSR